MENSNQLPTLDKKQALELWRKGRDEWNLWVKENPQYNISFHGANFALERGDRGVGNISFAGFNFPVGYVNFRGATFGDGDVFFSNATFGNGRVSFANATFGDGNVNFTDATFGDGNVSFIDATFGDGNVSFSGATFGDGDVSFSGATFGNSDVNFFDATFGISTLILNRAKIRGEVLFAPKQSLKPQSFEKLDFSHMKIDGYLALGRFSSPCVLILAIL